MTARAGERFGEAVATLVVALAARAFAVSGNYVLAGVMFATACFGAWLVVRR